MSNIKPIETVYNGYRFRSRLEARWAVFFDTAGIPYQYEPEGFVLEDGTHYLPDFYLPWFKCYVEIKPSGLQSEIDKGNDRIGKLVSGKSDCIGLVCIGEPKAGECGIAYYFGMGRTGELYLQSDIVGFYEGCWFKNIFSGDEYGYSKHWISLVSTHAGSGDRFYDKDGKEMPIVNGIGMTGYRSDFHEAALAAKQARFEHGENGAPKKTLSRQQQKKKTASPGDELMSKLSTLPPGDEKIAQILKECQRIFEMEKHGRFKDAPSWAIELHYLHSLESLGYEYTGTLDWEKMDWQRKACNEVFKVAGYTEIDPVTGLLMSTEYTKEMYRPSKDIVRFIDTLDGDVRKEVVRRFMSPGKPTWEEEIQLLDLYRETGFEPSGTLEAEQEIRAAIKKNT